MEKIAQLWDSYIMLFTNVITSIKSRRVRWAGGKWCTWERCEMRAKFLSQKLNGRYHLKDIRIDERKLLK
jgi:hypothetical protein